MRALPGASVELVTDWGATGATIGVRILDNEGNTVVARVEGFVEYPDGSGVYYLSPYVVPEEIGQYTLLYDDDAGAAAVGHIAAEELVVSGGGGDDVLPGEVYADTDELFRVLAIREPTAEQEVAASRVLQAATGEINSEIGLADGDSLAGWEYALAQEVCIERAVEHWSQMTAPFGIVGLGTELPTLSARDSWPRHRSKLSPLKRSWGVA